MKGSVRVALIGDYDSSVIAHQAIPEALALSAAATSCSVSCEWLATDEISENPAQRLSSYQGIWCVPASPYRSMEGALRAIQFARENQRPFLGTCGGFQHALIEFARDALGLVAADHTESNPGAEFPLIDRLSCSLAEAQEAIFLQPGSKVASIYGQQEISEQFNCNFGLNSAYLDLFEKSPLKPVGLSAVGEVRVIEHESHPFFVATLFQPERSARKQSAHPLINAFVQAAGSHSD
jgi:CTP synthase (UTP-ammonia lyase)